jgi:hypothetical protein
VVYIKDGDRSKDSSRDQEYYLDFDKYYDEDSVFNGMSQEDRDVIWDDLLGAICEPGSIGDMYEASSPSDITFWVLHTTVDRLWHYMRLSPQRYDEAWVDGEYGDCYGHYFTDVPAPFKNLVDDDDSYYTNEELYNLLSPYNEDLGYVYEHFDWDHCDDLGFDMLNTFDRADTPDLESKIFLAD